MVIELSGIPEPTPVTSIEVQTEPPTPESAPSFDYGTVVVLGSAALLVGGLVSIARNRNSSRNH